MEPDYISKFNMVLSVSQAAINRQLKHLYDTPAPNQPLPPPKGPNPPTKYLIDHKLDISIEVVDGELSGFIEAPQVSWSDFRGSAAKDSKVKMLFKFQENQGGDRENDSTFSWSEIVKINGKKELVDHDAVINGYTMSFEASIGRADIQQIEEAALKAMHPDIADQVEMYVDSKDFLVSSIFCVFEDAQISNTFRLLDASGNPVEEKAVIAWLTGINQHFGQLNGSTPDKNPFVLGYGITQEPSVKLPPAEFGPRSFQLSTSSDGVPTLNFLILTDERPISTETDITAGYIEPSFFTTCHTTAHDGILGMSSQLIADKFIGHDLANAYWYGVPNFGGAHINSESISNKVENFHHNLTWGTINEVFLATVLYHMTWWNGTSDLHITYTSDNQLNPDLPSDSKRRFIVDVKGNLVVKYFVDTSTVINKDDWSSAFEATVTCPYTTRLIIETGKFGQWIMTEDANYVNFPERDQQGNLIVEEGKNLEVKSYGIFKVTDFFHLTQFFEMRQTIGSIVGGLANTEVKVLADNISNGLDGISTKIIMPAGDVFLFDGLNTDDKGNLYSGITYSTISSDEFVHPVMERRRQVADVFEKYREAKRENGRMGKEVRVPNRRRVRNKW